MNCAEAKNLISDWLDNLLTEPQSCLFKAHLAGCAVCSREAESMQEMMSALRNLPQPALDLPPDFTASVLGRLRGEEKRPRESRILRIPVRTLAMAASLAFLLGMTNILVGSFTGGRLDGVLPGPVTDSGVVSPAEVLTPKTDTETPEPAVQTEPVEPVEPAVPVMPAEPQVTVSVPAAKPQPVRTAAVAKRSGVEPVYVAPEPVREPQAVPAAPVQNRLVSLANMVLPGPQVFVNQRRVTESTMVRVNVSRLDEASMRLAANAGKQGLVPTLEHTSLGADGRLIRVYRYEVPFREAYQFVAGTALLGQLVKEQRTQEDITGEYASKLAQYHRLADARLAASGSEAEKLNQSINALVSELARLDRLARDLQSVIVWLESDMRVVSQR